MNKTLLISCLGVAALMNVAPAFASEEDCYQHDRYGYVLWDQPLGVYCQYVETGLPDVQDGRWIKIDITLGDETLYSSVDCLDATFASYFDEEDLNGMYAGRDTTYSYNFSLCDSRFCQSYKKLGSYSFTVKQDEYDGHYYINPPEYPVVELDFSGRLNRYGEASHCRFNPDYYYSAKMTKARSSLFKRVMARKLLDKKVIKK